MLCSKLIEYLKNIPLLKHWKENKIKFHSTYFLDYCDVVQIVGGRGNLKSDKFLELRYKLQAKHSPLVSNLAHSEMPEAVFISSLFALLHTVTRGCCMWYKLQAVY